MHTSGSRRRNRKKMAKKRTEPGFDPELINEPGYCRPCNKVFKGEQGLLLHQAHMHKNATLDVSLSEAAAHHAERHSAKTFDKCASEPCAYFPRKDRAGVLATAHAAVADEAFETAKVLSEAEWGTDPR